MPKIKKEPMYISKSEAARLLGLSISSFNRWWKIGKLPLRRYKLSGHSVRFLKDEVEYLMESWVDSKKQGGATDEA